ncbi:VOC family protein [Amycolatopsis sp. H20-H5]|uniref:VOC family protein n=1 Tax=Amycolatopsis sp. H20-H5 TaxID=3046309 RepID=UPI002DBDE1C7|nr:VOC family protein [Amycolatopsis sp. H20-H5]MEC3981576.1 VOC family protein [Amycolatopsis sp. H20-H5]
MLFRDEPWPDGTPSWVDLMAPDKGKAVTFYSALLGWEVRAGTAETGYYGMATIAGRPVAGLGEIPAAQADAAPGWTTYLAVSDVDKVVAAVVEAGGGVHAPPMDVLDEGRMALVADPTGAMFGLWQAGKHAGTQVLAAPGAVAWNECMTTDFEAAKAFYSGVFGYGFDDMSAPGFQYGVLTVAGEVVGGLGGLPGGGPSHWGTYFSVEDADAAAAKVIELGGAVLNPPSDSPHGKVTVVADDQGSEFRLIAPNEQSGRPEGWGA